MDTKVPQKVYFYTVQFYINKGGLHYTHVACGRREELQKICDDFVADETVESCMAVYLSTFSAYDTAPVVVKAMKKSEKSEDK